MQDAGKGFGKLTDYSKMQLLQQQIIETQTQKLETKQLDMYVS